jgi:two-component system NtrC family sensor kinase
MQITTSLETAVLFVASLYVLKKNYLPARYFFIAWFILLIGALIFLLKDYGILPYNLFTSNSFRLASIVEMALLSFALASRINILKKEKEMSQAKELATSLENERLIREQNVVLEQKVEERTSELMEANESLQATLTHLKETQSQLVEAEKMASLGQLTAGVAHEINNPINFVTSNVAPLKRDINMIWDTLEEVEHLAFDQDLSLSEKKSRIQAYKEEIDIEYLKTEVDFLLKGMSDGANRTAEIVKSLRIFSRVDEDTLKFADINEGLESTMVILNSLIQQGIEVKKNYGDLPLIECYAGKLNQVFLNVLTNAIYAINKKFVNKPGGVLKLNTGIEEDQSFIFISIEDNGIGIPANIREKIFEPFFTTKDVGEGTGLGMSIAYNTIAKHNGKIVVDSVIGEGTMFKLIIPIRQII